MRVFRRAAVLAAALAPVVTVFAAACDKPAIVWRDPVVIAAPAADSVLFVDAEGSARFVAAETRPAGLPAAPGLCATTLTTAAGAHRVFAAWWSVRADSSAKLLVAWSPDTGRTWGMPLSVDTTDVSSAGCRRPPPAVAAVGDDVYVAYSMIAPEGTGVFFAHTMGSMLHSPVPVIYGERLVATAIAADDPRVAVAYEDPNGKRAQIGVALSMSQGHLFEVHTTASRSVDDAIRPAVAFSGKALAVSWMSRANGGAPVRMVRVGQLQ